MVQDFLGVEFSPGPSFSRVEENNNKSKWRPAASAVSKGGKRGRSKPGRVGVYKWYRNFSVISVGTGKRNTSEDFHLFGKLSGEMSCTI